MLTKKRELKPIWKDGICCCPVCGSKRILRWEQCIIHKVYNENTGTQLNPHTIEGQMSDSEKAWVYDNATPTSNSRRLYKCYECGWDSKALRERKI